MRKWAGAAIAVAALACGGGAATRPSGAPEEIPAWLAEGTGAFRGEGGKKLQGVGVASGVPDPRVRRQKADSAAREQLQVAVDAFAQALAADAPQDRAAIGQIARNAATRAAAIRDHWVTPDGDERAVSVVELDAFKQALQGVEGDDRIKGEMYGNAERAFDRVAAAGVR